MKKLKVYILILVLIICGCIYYVEDYYHTTDADSLKNTEKVKVKQTDFGYFFDGPGKNTALIFYPGAKVQDLSYAKLMKSIASKGVDCFIVHMPCNLAILSPNKADQVKKEYTYTHWYMAGHSLGGAMAANYTSSHKVDGLVLLAAYSTKKIDVPVLSIYGTQDKVLNKEKYISYKKNLPEDFEEVILNGANHAGYGVYGNQKKDGKASISNVEQIHQTADLIVQFCR